MSVRHVRARRGEHIVVHRDRSRESGGFFGFIILIIILLAIFS